MEDTRNSSPPFTRIDNPIIDEFGPRIGAMPLAVLVVLARHADNKTRRCHPGIRRIAQCLHTTPQTVRKAITVLEQEGLIRVDRRRTMSGQHSVNVYTLLPILRGQKSLPPLVKDVNQGGEAAMPELDLINKTQVNYREGARSAPSGPAVAGPEQPHPAHLKDQHLTNERGQVKHLSESDPDHPAVKLYRAICEVTPNKVQREAMIASVTDIPGWQEVLRWWMAHNYNRTNVPGMLDRYQKGLDARSDGNGWTEVDRRAGFGSNRRGEVRGSSSTETPEQLAQRDAAWQALVSRSKTGREHCDKQ